MSVNKKIIKDIVVGQGWIELEGAFTFDELRSIAQRVEKNYLKARNGNKK